MTNNTTAEKSIATYDKLAKAKREVIFTGRQNYLVLEILWFVVFVVFVYLYERF